MLSRSRLLFVGALSGAFAGAPATAQQTASVPGKAASTAGAPKALDRANLDTTCAACSDFYTFANGGWLKHTTIPAKYGEWGAFDQLQDQNETIVREIVEAAASDVKTGKAKAPSRWRGLPRSSRRRICRLRSRSSRNRTV
jgi:putative endopeptidase